MKDLTAAEAATQSTSQSLPSSPSPSLSIEEQEALKAMTLEVDDEYLRREQMKMKVYFNELESDVIQYMLTVQKAEARTALEEETKRSVLQHCQDQLKQCQIDREKTAADIQRRFLVPDYEQAE